MSPGKTVSLQDTLLLANMLTNPEIIDKGNQKQAIYLKAPRGPSAYLRSYLQTILDRSIGTAAYQPIQLEF